MSGSSDKKEMAPVLHSICFHYGIRNMLKRKSKTLLKKGKQYIYVFFSMYQYVYISFKDVWLGPLDIEIDC